MLIPLSALVGLAFTSACRSKPTQDQCNALADHMAQLIKGAKLKDAQNAERFVKKDRDLFVNTCVREGSYNTVQCMLEAPNWDALQSECSP